MKLTKYQKEAIVRAILQDVPKPDMKKRREAAQAAIVKLMSPACRKVYRENPKALATVYVGDRLNDGYGYEGRNIIAGDVSDKQVEVVLAPYKEEDEKRSETCRNLNNAIMSCTTLASLQKMFPEFKKYYPTEVQPTKNLPALANVVADLSKLGWPKKAAA
jgi:hypothetical protein